ncbi:MAG: AAA family ATPase [Bacteroidales bacterium]|nr:AAA family ATPase [Bacteroidales bacterium]
MKCQKCGHDNRAIARYCKWCGQALAAAAGAAKSDDRASVLDRMVGKDSVADTIRRVLTSASNIAAQGRNGGVDMRLDMCFAITGATGVGKNFVADVIAAALHETGIIARPTPHVVKSIDFKSFADKLRDNVKPIGGNVLVIDDAHTHCPSERADTICELDRILQYCAEWGPDPDRPVVVFVGDDDLLKFFENNASARARIKEMIRVPAPTIEDLTEICCRRLEREYGRQVQPEARAKISRVITAAKRDNVDRFTYGHYAVDLAYRIYLNFCAVPGAVDITPDMVQGREWVPKTFDDVMREFDRYVGVDDIKEAIRNIALTVDEARRRGGDSAACGSVQSHFLFIGNPGTGKTTMARLFAEALNAMGALPSGHLVEVDRGKLVSQYVGETPKLVRKAVNEAMGGVLFIDEAYQLWQGKNDHDGEQAITTLLADCENLRGKFVCLMAGYPVEMQRLMGANAGLARRFNKTIEFRDYTGPELTRIFRNMAAASDTGVKLGDDVEAQIGSFFDKMYAKRGSRFGNAGTVRNVLEEALGRMRVRVDRARAAGSLVPGTEHTLIMADLHDNGGGKAVDDILATFDDLVGMSDVKRQIETIAKRVRLNQRRLESGRGKAQVENFHIVITGNPGTGKTTVAKRLGQVFKAIGVLPTDKVIVKKKEDLLDQYANSAGINMRQAVEDAMGGILFIDEAYTLLPTGTPGTVNQDGAEAVQALMTCMSEREGQFITVMAGYKSEMDEFIRNANDGLARRFTHSIHIDDYSAEDLFKIYMQQAERGGFSLTEAAKEKLRLKIEEMVTVKDEKFGNAGTMIKLFEQTTDRQADRVDPDADDDALFTIEADDIPYDAPKKLDVDQIMARLDHLTGLQSVKNAVHDLADRLTIEMARTAPSGQKPQVNLSHYLFLGNPGTGKTTVARIMGDIFYSLGLLPSNKVIELSAKDLKSEFMGQTSPKAHAAMMRGMGGVVFIDEAYSITEGDGQGGYGKEAVAEILQVMENYRNRFITIAAGYPREMQQFLDSNSGLQSRFAKPIMFDDYSAEELSTIALGMFEKRNLSLTQVARDAMLRHFTRLVNARSKNFANAREARNYVDEVLLNQGRRLREESARPGFDNDRLYVIEASDMNV